jgi:hypothetical protein
MRFNGSLYTQRLLRLLQRPGRRQPFKNITRLAQVIVAQWVCYWQVAAKFKMGQALIVGHCQFFGFAQTFLPQFRGQPPPPRLPLEHPLPQARLGLAHRITENFGDAVMLPAAGQGALCIEIRENDARTALAIGTLDHGETRRTVLGERAFLHRMGGSCQVPIAAHGKMIDGQYRLSGLVAEIDGSHIIRDTMQGSADDFKRIGIALADRLLGMGADRILERLTTE